MILMKFGKVYRVTVLKPISRSFLLLFFLVAFSLITKASDFSKDLEGVNNLRHPARNWYTSGQPKPESFKAFAKAGVAHVINLRPPAEMPNVNEAAIVTRADMAYYNIPIKGAEDLTRSNILLLDSLLTKIGDEKILIHCSSSNRVGAIMALRAAWVEGASSEESISIGKRYGLTRLQPAVEQLLK